MESRDDLRPHRRRLTSACSRPPQALPAVLSGWRPSAAAESTPRLLGDDQMDAERAVTMRFIIAATVWVALISLMPLPAAAESHEGVVRHIRIDSEADPPLCVTTIPDMPGGAWACIYQNRRHYLEMKEMLLQALNSRHTCTFEWTQRDTLTNRAQIISITCSAR